MADGPSSSKKPRMDITADWKYEPEDMTDLIIKCRDDKTIACHKIFILRDCKMFARLLDDCPDDSQVTVTEDYDVLRSCLLDIIYDRSVQITPDNVVQVLKLADKYEAPSVVRACAAVLSEPHVKLTLEEDDEPRYSPATDDGKEETTIFVLDGLSLAIKHEIPGLKNRCLDYLKERLCIADVRGVRSCILVLRRHQDDTLSTFPAPVLLEMNHVLLDALDALRSGHDEAAAQSNKVLADERAKYAKLEKEQMRRKKNYKQLLTKYNKLLAKTKAAGLQV